MQYNWHQAWHECARRDQQLVTIESADKNNAIIDLVKRVVGKSHNLWLGGNDEYSSSRDYGRPFFWSPTGQPFSFAYWSENNPDNYKHQEHCVHIWDTKPLYQWNDNDCNVKMGFICEPNHFRETYNNALKQKCEALKITNSKISTEFDQLQAKQSLEIDSITEKVAKVNEDWKIEIEKLQNATQIAIQQIMKNHENQVKHLSETLLKQLKDSNEQIKQSTEHTNAEFGEKLKGQQAEINEIC